MNNKEIEKLDAYGYFMLGVIAGFFVGAFVMLYILMDVPLGS